MVILNKFAIFFVLFCCLFSIQIHGIEANVSISEEEDLEIEMQLKLLNKPSIKTIQTKYGDTYDCVEFYKQSAFDHPLLKNHTFNHKMRPSFVPQIMNEKKNSTYQNIKLVRVNCPDGTVPIKRVTKDDLIRAKLDAKTFESNYTILNAENPGFRYAVIRTKDDNIKYTAAGTGISIHNVPVAESQFSSTRMKISAGSNSIKAGVTMNPTLYGDGRTRGFIHFKTSQSECYNLRCPGFVHVRKEYPIDAILPPSVMGGPISIVSVYIQKDPVNGNWWYFTGNPLTALGFWPVPLFGGGLDGPATKVEWGGESFSPPDVPSPPLGSGLYVSKKPNIFRHAFCEQIITLDDSHVRTYGLNTESYADRGYQVNDRGDYKDGFGHLMFYGGPGGEKGN